MASLLKIKTQWVMVVVSCLSCMLLGLRPICLTVQERELHDLMGV